MLQAAGQQFRGLRVAGTSENHGPEQERLNNVFGARLRITTLRDQRAAESQVHGLTQLAEPSVDQTIMLAQSMVVVASMIGVQGMGQPVLRPITNQYFAMGLLNGLAIVVIAIVFDRVSQAYGLRLQKNREGSHV